MKKILLLGDWIDKGPDSRGVIEFIYNNQEWFFLTVGNHENWVYKYLKGIIPAKSVEPGLIENYFDTVLLLQDDEELREKFFELVENAKSFYIHKEFVVTHAPCRNKYIGKLHGKSLKYQQHVMYPKMPGAESIVDKIVEFFYRKVNKKTKKMSDRESAYIKEIEIFFSFLKQEASLIHPSHFFGHIACGYMTVFNKINIDTGCYKGGKLTYATIKPGEKMSIDCVLSKQKKTSEGLLDFFLS